MKLPAFAKTLALVAIVLFFSLRKDGGIWLVLVIPVIAIWALYNFVRLIWKPAERRARVIRVAIWGAALALVGATQAYWANASRTQGDAVVAAVFAYKIRTGSYPASLAEAGLDAQGLKDEWRLRYELRAGKPELSYPSSLMFLTLYEYDFEARQWKTNAY